MAERTPHDEIPLDADGVPIDSGNETGKGNNLRTVGPSDSSDAGSDLLGPGLIDDDLMNLDRGTNEDSEGGSLSERDAGASVGDLELDENSDRYGTGEHLAAGKEPHLRVGGDIDVDRIVPADRAGLGGGLDQAEEAQLGITDEEIEDLVRDDDDEPRPL